MNGTLTEPWRTHRITLSGVGIAVFEAGNTDPHARTLVLVHGLGYWTQAAWGNLVPLIDPALRIVAFDIPGFGSSDKPHVRYDVDFLTGVLAAVIDRVAPGRVMLCGHSLGGFMCAMYAATHVARVSHLVLIAPAGFSRDARFFIALAGSQLACRFLPRRAARALVNRTLDHAVFDATSLDGAVRATAQTLIVETGTRRAFAGVYAAAVRDVRNARAIRTRLRAYTGPTLTIWGRHDRFIPINVLAQLMRTYPQAVPCICERSAHLPMVEEPEQVARAIGAFLAAGEPYQSPMRSSST